MSKLVTYEDLLLEERLLRCKLALKELDVPTSVIRQFDQWEPSMLLQFTHMTINYNPPVPWQNAFSWCKLHKDKIIHHGRKLIEQERRAREGNRKTSDDSSVSGD